MPAYENSLPLPLTREEAIRCFPDLDTWLRLNPQWSLLGLAPGRQAGEYELLVRDEQSEREIRSRLVVTAPSPAGAWTLELTADGRTRHIEVQAVEAEHGVRLIYREADVAEQDIPLHTNLSLWHRSCADYLLLTHSRGLRSRLMKWLLDRVWLRMSQPGRRITFLVVVSELAALALFLLWLAWYLAFERG